MTDELTLGEWIPPRKIGETAQLLLELTERKKALKDFCEKDLHQRIAAVENHLLDQMVDQGIGMANAGGTTFYKQNATDVSWAGGDKASKNASKVSLMRLLQLLSDADERSPVEEAFCNLLKLTADVRSIGTLVREMQENGEYIPEQIMQHLQVKKRTTIGKRASG